MADVRGESQAAASCEFLAGSAGVGAAGALVWGTRTFLPHPLHLTTLPRAVMGTARMRRQARFGHMMRMR